MTDDVHIVHHAQRWQFDAERPTKGAAIAERTASIVWGVLNRIDASIFLWNVYPLHPHEPGNPFSNRAHTAKERKLGEEVLRALISLLRPTRIVAIGNAAAAAATRMGSEQQVVAVRHPSYGGQNQFIAQVSDLYGISRAGGRLL